MARELALLGAAFVQLTLPEAGVVSVFQAVRRQPAEGKVCTAEALAFLLEEMHAWRQRGQALVPPPPPPLPPPLPLPPDAAELPASPFAGPHLHFAALPALASARAKALVLAAACLVDRHVKQTSMLGGRHSRGAGFRTWRLGAGAGPLLGGLPAHLVERICAFAYGEGRVAASGYFARTQARTGGVGVPAAHCGARVPLAQASTALSVFAGGGWQC